MLLLSVFFGGYKMKTAWLLALFCGAATASEAPWYKWINSVDRTILCSQVSPGDAWAPYDGPYQESRCKKPGSPQ